jgi:hypothetical protein
MELSYSHRFIFVHVYRTGGQSVSHALRPYSYAPSRLARVPFMRRQIDILREHYYGHIKAHELRAALAPEVFDTFFKFSFVRNPWDWHVSIYQFIVQRPEHPQHSFISAMRGFEDYLDWRINRQPPELQKEFVLGESGELLVDFVGRHEALERDFTTVCGHLGIEASLPHRNRSEHLDFREYYTARTRELVAETYKEDIELFGYEFDRQDALPAIRGPKLTPAQTP